MGRGRKAEPEPTVLERAGYLIQQLAFARIAGDQERQVEIIGRLLAMKEEWQHGKAKANPEVKEEEDGG